MSPLDLSDPHKTVKLHPRPHHHHPELHPTIIAIMMMMTVMGMTSAVVLMFIRIILLLLLLCYNCHYIDTSDILVDDRTFPRGSLLSSLSPFLSSFFPPFFSPIPSPPPYTCSILVESITITCTYCMFPFFYWLIFIYILSVLCISFTCLFNIAVYGFFV